MYGVFMRYVVKHPPIFVEEVSAYLLVLIVFFAAARTFREGGHIRVEVVEGRLPQRVRLWLREIVLFLGLTYGLVLEWEVWRLIQASRAFSVKSFFLRVPAYIPQGLILFGLGLLILVLGAELARHTARLWHGGKE